VGGVGRQIVRDWVERFNARGPEGLIDGKAPGNRPKLSDAQREALVAIVEQGPTPEIHGVVRWRLVDLVQWIEEQFEITLDETNVSRELKKLGYYEAFGATAPPRSGSGGAGGRQKGVFAAELAKVRARLPRHRDRNLVSG
jgi:hypothetical protein